MTRELPSHLDIENLHPVDDLARGHAEQSGGFGLHPTGLFQRRDFQFSHITRPWACSKRPLR